MNSHGKAFKAALDHYKAMHMSHGLSSIVQIDWLESYLGYRMSRSLAWVISRYGLKGISPLWVRFCYAGGGGGVPFGFTNLALPMMPTNEGPISQMKPDLIIKPHGRGVSKVIWDHRSPTPVLPTLDGCGSSDVPI